VERSRVLDVTEPNGRFEVFLPGPSLHVTRATGYLSLAMARRWMELIEPVFEKSSPLANHHHWLRATGYETSARRLMTRWAIRRASDCKEIQFLCQSKILAMGLATVNLALAYSSFSVIATTSEHEFRRRLSARMNEHAPASTPRL